MLEKQSKPENGKQSIDEVFNQAIETSDFKKVFASPEIYRDLILANIQQIASIIDNGKEFATTDNMPEWLIDSLLSYGAELD